jgi:hypothetical protein
VRGTYRLPLDHLSTDRDDVRVLPSQRYSLHA